MLNRVAIRSGLAADLVRQRAPERTPRSPMAIWHGRVRPTAPGRREPGKALGEARIRRAACIGDGPENG